MAARPAPVPDRLAARDEAPRWPRWSRPWPAPGRSQGGSGSSYLALRGGRSLDSGEQGLDLVGAVVSRSVDVEGWGAIHIAADAAHEVLAHARGMDVLGQLLVELLDVETEHLGVATQIL